MIFHDCIRLHPNFSGCYQAFYSKIHTLLLLPTRVIELRTAEKMFRCQYVHYSTFVLISQTMRDKMGKQQRRGVFNNYSWYW